MDKKYTAIGKLGALIFVVPVVVWGFSLRKTVDLWHNYVSVRERLEQMQVEELGQRSLDFSDTCRELLLPDGRLLEKWPLISGKRKLWSLDLHLSFRRRKADLLCIQGNFCCREDIFLWSGRCMSWKNGFLP